MDKNHLIEVFKNLNPCTPMDEVETLFLFNMMLNNTDNLNQEIDEIDKSCSEYIHFQLILESQLLCSFSKILSESAEIKFTCDVLLLLAFHINSIKDMEVYASYISSKLPYKTLVNLDIYCEKLFPWGFFSEDQINSLSQVLKVGMAA